MEKNLGPYSVITLGHILEAAIQRGPALYKETNQTDKAITQYRSLINACETQSTHQLRGIISRQMAETILRNVSASAWVKFDASLTTASGPWKPLRYFGQSLFVPKTREEELVLLLLISESLASRNMILDRSPEYAERRQESIDAVAAVYDLLTITLTPFGYYYLDAFERAMKYSFEVKHIWFQFALSLAESKKNPPRACRLFEEVARIDQSDPLPLLLAAKLAMVELEDARKGLNLATAAHKRCSESHSLYGKSCLLIGIANALIYEVAQDSVKKIQSDYMNDAIKCVYY